MTTTAPIDHAAAPADPDRGQRSGASAGDQHRDHAVPRCRPGRRRTARTRWAPSLTPPRAACWYLAFAGYALAAGLAGGQALQRSWGTWAACGYGAAALAAFAWRSRGRDLALVFALAGSIAAPLAWQQTAGRGMPDGMESALWVVARSARLLLAHGSPYLPAAQLAHPLSYDPYLPAMTIFGLPDALGLPAAVGNPRLWFAVTAGIALWLAARRAVRCSAIRITAFALASPVLAFGIAVGGTDVPVLALLCLASALVGTGNADDGLTGEPGHRCRPWPTAAGLVAGAACAMKATAWPAVPVLIAMLAVRDGRRSALRFAAAAASTSVAGVLAAAPAMLAKPASLVQNTILFPLGLTRQPTPAASPLPGHLLASSGTAGHWATVALLGTAAAALAVSLVLKPPDDLPSALIRLATGLTLMITLAPATRWGYLAYPAGLLGWVTLTTRSPARDPKPATHQPLPAIPPDHQADPQQAVSGHLPRANSEPITVPGT